MEWLRELLAGQTLGHVLLILSFVIAVGLTLGRIKVRGVSLGATFVLLTGIVVSHFGAKFPEQLFVDAEGTRHFIAPSILHFVKEYGLILFVYAIGMQVGAGFFSAFKKGGLPLNFLALCVVGLGVATTCAVRGVFHLSTPVAVGILSGAVTNTPGLGAAQSTYATMSANVENIPEAYAAVMSNAYAAAYPLGVLGTIMIVFFARILARGNKASTDSAIESGTESSAESTKPAPSDPTPRVNASSVAKVFVGIMLGVILGSCPIPIPGLSQPLRLGLAGGPLVVSILMGAFARNLHMHSLLPSNSLLSMREIGICLFLAAVGLDAGPTFVETMRGGGLQWACFGAAITILPLAIVVLPAVYFFKVDGDTLAGVVAGSMTDPPALSYSVETADNNRPLVGYATVYPLSMFLRIMTAQALVAFMP